MKVQGLAIVSLLVAALSAPGQVSKPGFGDKGCPDTPFFAENASISGNDFIEVHRFPSYSRAPAYTVRLYGDGRVVWHGEEAVTSMGDASARADGDQVRAIIRQALKVGFGVLCDEYAMKAFDGSTSVTKLNIAGKVKSVANTGPSDAPSWLYKVQEQVAALAPVQKLIGAKQEQPHIQR